MSTAYKYVEREAEDQINWAEVGANLTGVLKEENRVREEKRGAIDEATKQFTQVLNDVPKGQNTELNKFALNAAADLQEQMLIQEKLLKSGHLKPRDYTIMRQNLTDGTDQAFSLFENYNAEYDIKMARMNTSLPINEQGSIIESWNMELVEGFGNFKESKLVIDSRTGIMSMAKMIPDPNFKGTGPAPLIPDMNNLMSVQNMENRLKTQYNKYDVLGQAENYLDSLGVDERSEIERQGSTYEASIFKKITDTTAKVKGGYKSMSDDEKAELSRATGVPINELDSITLFQESQDNWVKGQLSKGSIAGASVILDFRNRNPKTNEKFEPMMDSPKARELAKTDSNIVIMKNVDGRMVPELSEDQQIYAERILKAAINSGVDYKEEHNVAKTESAPPQRNNASYIEAQRKRDKGEADEIILDSYNNVAKLWYGTDEEVNEAINYLKSSNPDIISIDRNSTSVTIVYENGRKEVMDFQNKDKTQRGQESWTKANANYFLGENKILNFEDIREKSSISKDAKFNSTSAGYSATESAVKDTLKLARDYATESLSLESKIGVEQNEDDFKRDFDAKFIGLGFSTDIPTSGYELTNITGPTGDTFPYYSNYKANEGGAKYLKALEEWVNLQIAKSNHSDWNKTQSSNTASKTTTGSKNKYNK